MMTSIISALALVLPAALAAPAPVDPSALGYTLGNETFSGITIRSGSPIQYGTINANGTYFYVNNYGTSTYCPLPTCLGKTNTTIFKNGVDKLALDVMAPGGQEVYVDRTGALRFTVAHSASKGRHSLTSGFALVNAGLRLQFEGQEWLACPVEGVKNGYKVYAAAVTTDNSHHCLGFQWRVAPSTGLPAFEYA
ncbi:hypothetical protein AAFC00_006037 [Neodothiora populina]|uniref:Uncharacterized protein n=1 Tax=Neodothiora populina TaxID=2781224 RepID=A0ABR3P718_9PEZI